MDTTRWIWTAMSVVELLCLFFLSCSYVSCNAQHKAVLFGISEKGEKHESATA